MKKELYLTLCALATTLPVAAQQRNFQITGTLCDSITREAQAFATIRLLDKTAKDGAVKGAKTATEKVLRVATTEANGKFKITVPKAGNYTLEAVVIGMQPLRRDVTLSTTQPTLKLDTLASFVPLVSTMSPRRNGNVTESYFCCDKTCFS